MNVLIILLTGAFFSHHATHTMASTETESKIVHFPITPHCVFEHMPKNCLPTVLCKLIADYTKGWLFQSRVRIPCSNNPLWGIIPIVDGDNLHVIAHELTNGWLVNLKTNSTLKINFPQQKFRRCFTYAPKRKILMAMSLNLENGIKLYNFKNMTVEKLQQRPFPSHRIQKINYPSPKTRICPPALSPHEDKFAVADSESIYTYSLPSGKLLHTTSGPRLLNERSLRWNYNGTFLSVSAYSEYGSILHIWNCEDKPIEASNIQMPSVIHALACSPRKNIVAVKTDNRLSCFEIPSGTQRWSTVIDDSNSNGSLVFSPSGEYIASPCESTWHDYEVDGETQNRKLTTIGIWDVENGTQVASFPKNDPVGVVAFLSDDTLIIAGDSSRSIMKSLYIFSLK